MKWVKPKLISLIFVVGIFGAFIGAVSVAPTAYADAASSIDDLTDRWLRYRAIAGCYSVQDVGKNNIDKINAGTWFQSETWGVDIAQDARVALGYKNSDGKVNCGDGSFVTNSIKKIGFENNQVSFCAMSTAKRNDSKDYSKCMNGSGDLDMDGGTSEQVKAFKDAKAAKVSDSAKFPYEPKGEILYWVGLQSLKKFCNATRGEKYENSMSGNVANSKTKVVVNEVDLSSGAIVRYVYNLKDKKEGDNVSMLWAETGSGYDGSTRQVNDKEMSCAKLAQLTWTHDNAFSKYVKDYNAANPDDVAAAGSLSGASDAGGDGSLPEGKTCAIEGGLGWIICPTLNFLADISDGLFGFLADNFLETPATLFDLKSTEGKAMFSAWTRFRDMANIAFVIFFLFIIYSQLVGGSRGGGAGAEVTGGMLSNYGVKKLLPRVIVSAVLINVSFWLCAIAIDVSNIIGYGVKTMFDSVAGAAEIQSALDPKSTTSTWANVTEAVIMGATGTVVVFMNLAALIGFMGLAIVALIVIVVILLIRKALIILLIVVAPIALVAYMLPNTKTWFEKWRKTFTTLLMVFPVIGLVFGASSLASIIVQATADDQLTKILGAAIMILPLIAVPTIIKGSLSTIGQLGAKINGVGDRLGGKARTAAEKRAMDGRLGEVKSALAAGRQRRKINRRVGDGKFGQLNRRIDNSAFGRRLGLGAGAARATEQYNEDYEKRVKEGGTLLQARMSHDQIMDAARTGKGSDGKALTAHERDAAIRYTMDRGNFNERRRVVEGVGDMTRDQRKSLGSGLRAKGDASVYGNSAVAAIEATHLQGKTGMSAADADAELSDGIVRKVNDGELSVETIAKDHRVAKAVADATPGAKTDARDRLREGVERYQRENAQDWSKLDDATKMYMSAI